MKVMRILFPVLLLAFVACTENVEPEIPETPVAPETPASGNATEQEREEINAFIERRNKAMIDRDIETLNTMMADDLVLVHMSGATQSKQEWLDEIVSETMRYYAIEIRNLTINVENDTATVSYLSIIEARIWGTHNTWRMNSSLTLMRTADGWIWTNTKRPDTNRL